MIIGFDGSRAFVGGRTGTENYSYQLLKALAKLDQTNNYLVYTRSKIQPNFPKNFIFKEIKWPRLWTQGGLSLQTFIDKLDVLFVPAHTLPLIRKPGLKTVVTVHDLGSEYLPSMHQVKQRLYLSFMQKYQLQTADKIIAVSNATKDDLVKRLEIGPKKINVIYEGYNKELFKKTDTEVNSMKYFLFVGTVQPRKNLERIIKAVAQTDKTLIVAGSRGWMSEKIYKLPKQLGIEERVKFLGFVPDEGLPALYSGAIAFLYPSLFEGFGLPILEAQACGCPVITSNVSSMPEVAGKGAVYVNPYSVDDIVEGMQRLQATGYRQQIIQKGFANIKRFSWEKCAAQTLKVFENLKFKI